MLGSSALPNSIFDLMIVNGKDMKTKQDPGSFNRTIPPLSFPKAFSMEPRRSVLSVLSGFWTHVKLIVVQGCVFKLSENLQGRGDDITKLKL